MKKDNLEQFIFEQRDAFDDQLPSLKVWADIDRQMNKKEVRRITMWRNLRVAAAVVALLVAGGIAGSYISQPAEADPVAILEEIAPEFTEMEQYYKVQIKDRIQQLASYNTDNTVLADLEQVDEVMNELKEELARAPKGKEQEIIENLIQTYQTKMAILERVLDRIQETTEQQNLKPKDDEISI